MDTLRQFNTVNLLNVVHFLRPHIIPQGLQERHNSVAFMQRGKGRRAWQWASEEGRSGDSDAGQDAAAGQASGCQDAEAG